MRVAEIVESRTKDIRSMVQENSAVIINEAPYIVVNFEGNILTAVPQGGEQPVKIDTTGWVLEMGPQGAVFRQPKGPYDKDRSMPPGSPVDVQGQPRIIGTPERG